MFEGTAQQMNTSLERLRALPSDTKVYCGHEYTAANLRFALAVEPENAATLAYQQTVTRLRDQDLPTLPSELALESQVNPFLRCDTERVRQVAEQHAGSALPDAAHVFGVLRAWKDTFR